MEIDENLYDEFGNYIGPEIKAEDDDEEEHQKKVESEEDIKKNDIEEEEEPDIKQEQLIEDQKKQVSESNNEIVLHEDKKYYPEIEEVYPNAEVLIQEEDIQPITEPIIAPVKSKDFDLIEKEIPETNYSLEFLQNLMHNQELIRNIAFVGHLHHGKTSLMDMLVRQTHLKYDNMTTNYRYTDARKDEQERLISIKSAPMTFILPNMKEKSFVFNVFDTPGHINFQDEVCSALRACDGVVLVVDAVEGVMLGTEKIIKYLVQQRIAITVLINKIDRLIIELKLPPADAYLKIKHTLEEINAVIMQSAFNQPDLEKLKVSPLLGNVAFGSSMYGFVFTLQSFAQQYSQVYKIAPQQLEKLLWGNYYLDKESNKISKKPTKDTKNRLFVEFILEPIYKIFSHICSKEMDFLEPFLEKLGVQVSKSEYKRDSQDLLKIVFQRFFGNTAPLIDMVISHVPNAQVGSQIKLQQFYLGDKQSEQYKQVSLCTPQGPLYINIVKQYNKPDCILFDVLGRIISGKITQGQQVKILGENYSIEDEEDMTVREAKYLYLNQSRYKLTIKEAIAGNWVLIEGIDQSISKSATVVEFKEQALSIMRPIQFCTTPVVKVAIEPLIPSELPKMLDGLRKVNKSYPILITKVEESGEHVLIGTGELYMDCVLHDLRLMYSEIEIKVSDPSVRFCETVIDTSAILCYAETPNKKNKVTMTASPLDVGLSDDIEREYINLDGGKKIVQKYFMENYKWDELQAKSIWSFGPSKFGPNIILDDTLPSETNKSLLIQCKETIIQGFQWATREGPLCDEPVRNVKFKIIKADIADEAIYRAGGQIIPTARRCCYSSMLMASPRMMEPLFLVEIQCSGNAAEAVYAVLQKRRGHSISEVSKVGTPLITIKATIPAIDSFGFETDLRIHTSGQAFCLAVFDTWEMLPGDPLDKNIKLNLLEPSPAQHLAKEFMVKTRRRKGLNENVSIVKFFDDQELIKALKQEKEFKDYI